MLEEQAYVARHCPDLKCAKDLKPGAWDLKDPQQRKRFERIADECYQRCDR
jgi:hypothetical protein